VRNRINAIPTNPPPSSAIETGSGTEFVTGVPGTPGTLSPKVVPNEKIALVTVVSELNNALLIVKVAV
jgi:hypothetical protein